MANITFLSFLLFSMCHSIHVAVNTWLNCSFFYINYCVLITVDNFVMGLTLRPVEARPNRKAENGSGVIGKGQRVSSRRSSGAMLAPPSSSQ